MNLSEDQFLVQVTHNLNQDIFKNFQNARVRSQYLRVRKGKRSEEGTLITALWKLFVLQSLSSVKVIPAYAIMVLIKLHKKEKYFFKNLNLLPNWPEKKWTTKAIALNLGKNLRKLSVTKALRSFTIINMVRWRVVDHCMVSFSLTLRWISSPFSSKQKSFTLTNSFWIQKQFKEGMLNDYFMCIYLLSVLKEHKDFGFNMALSGTPFCCLLLSPTFFGSLVAVKLMRVQPGLVRSADNDASEAKTTMPSPHV